ncbi:MAG: DUF4199 domain-containing protein [Bacteroidales bacterium]|nr:DUF4199 domain-containing protein [Bacteroidales bacterium]
MDLTFNQIQGYVFIVVQIGLIYFLLKSYRDNFMHGQITYGQSLGAGMIIFLYSAIIVAVYTYLLYTVIDSGLVAKQLAFQEAEMVKRGIPQASIDAGMAMQAKIMKPAIIAPISILGSMFWGLIVSLLISIFIRKEGNPLIETPQN